MLILMRRPGEDVVIRTPNGDVITVAVMRVQGRGVALGFDAPRSYGIDRAEIDARKQAEHA
jgi:carbon storage regulator CsrA